MTNTKRRLRAAQRKLQEKGKAGAGPPTILVWHPKDGTPEALERMIAEAEAIRADGKEAFVLKVVYEDEDGNEVDEYGDGTDEPE
jgi:hypothetical protein